MKNQIHQIFVVNNSISAIVSRLVIKELALAEDGVLIICLRHLDIGFLFPYSEVLTAVGVGDVEKSRVPHRFSLGFDLYVPWDGKRHGVMNYLVEHPRRGRVSYIEEGNLSYKKTVMPSFRSALKSLRVSKFKYRRSAKSYAMDGGAFPFISASNRVVLKFDIESFGSYRRRLRDRDVVVVLPSNKYDITWRRAVEFLEKGEFLSNCDCYLKLHPYHSCAPVTDKTAAILRDANSRGVKVLPHNTMLEIEMFFSDILLLGRSTGSLRHYAGLAGRRYVSLV